MAPFYGEHTTADAATRFGELINIGHIEMWLDMKTRRTRITLIPYGDEGIRESYCHAEHESVPVALMVLHRFCGKRGLL